MPAQPDMVKRFQKRRRKPPRDDTGPPVRAIPGYGEFVGPYNAGHRPSYDRSYRGPYSQVPKQRAPYGGPRSRRIRRRPTRPRPRNRPTLD